MTMRSRLSVLRMKGPEDEEERPRARAFTYLSAYQRPGDKVKN